MNAETCATPKRKEDSAFSFEPKDLGFVFRFGGKKKRRGKERLERVEVYPC